MDNFLKKCSGFFWHKEEKFKVPDPNKGVYTLSVQPRITTGISIEDVCDLDFVEIKPIQTVPDFEWTRSDDDADWHICECCGQRYCIEKD